MIYKQDIRQNRVEFQSFIDLARAEGVQSYLEIGSRFGGTLWWMATSLPPGSRVVAIDLPHDSKGRESLEACVEQLRNIGYDAQLILGDSANQTVVAGARNLAPFDLCFIDANHTEPYVRADWASYGPLARIVAFHDISWLGPRPNKESIDVPQVWAEIKGGFRHVEFKQEPRDNGIGVLWRC